MFDDFHESSRTAGIGGLIIGLLVLAGFSGLGIAVMNGDVTKAPSLASKIVDQERLIEQITGDLKKKKLELEQFKEAHKAVRLDEAKFAIASQDLVKETELRDQHQKVVDELNVEVKARQLKFEAYRTRYRGHERARAEGELLDLSETKGEGYEKCKVIGISPLYLRVMHRSGPIGIPYAELPADIQDRFQFAQQEAAEYQNRLNVLGVQLTKNAAEMKRRYMIKKGENERQAMMRAIEESQADIRAKSNYAMKLKKEAFEWEAQAKNFDQQAANAKIFGRISSAPGQARKARSKASQYSKRARAAQLEVLRLELEKSEYERRLRAAR